MACLHHVFPLFPSSRDSCSPQWPGPPAAHPGADKDEVLALCPVLLFLKHDAQLVLDPLGLIKNIVDMLREDGENGIIRKRLNRQKNQCLLLDLKEN